MRLWYTVDIAPVKRRTLLKLIRRLHSAVPSITGGYPFECRECGGPHPCRTYRLADGFTKW